MLPEYLLPVTTVRESGYGPIITVRGGGEGTAVLTLGITRITEREALRVSIWGSADQSDWDGVPLASFTNKFYCGEYETELDLSQHPNIRHIRVQWEVDHESRGRIRPMCTLWLRAKAAKRQLMAMGA
jgi:hypothetical protein